MEEKIVHVFHIPRDRTPGDDWEKVQNFLKERGYEVIYWEEGLYVPPPEKGLNIVLSSDGVYYMGYETTSSTNVTIIIREPVLDRDDLLYILTRDYDDKTFLKVVQALEKMLKEKNEDPWKIVDILKRVIA